MTIQETVESLIMTYATYYWIGQEYINLGNCEEFACDLVRRVGRGYVEWLGPNDDEEVGHCAALIDGRWYDSDTPNGVEDWKNLGNGRWCTG